MNTAKILEPSYTRPMFGAELEQHIQDTTILVNKRVIDGITVEIRVSTVKEPGDDKAVARFLWELMNYD